MYTHENHFRSAAYINNHLSDNDSFLKVLQEGQKCVSDDSQRCLKAFTSFGDSNNAVPPPPPPYDTIYCPQLTPKSDQASQTGKSPLLSLPKNLRLLIWEHAFEDFAALSPLVQIHRAPITPSSISTAPPMPTSSGLSFSCTARHLAPSQLLLVNKLIYEEALPYLYNSVIFMPSNITGLLPIWYTHLSPFAKSYVHNIRLRVPDPHAINQLLIDRSAPFFHWAVTCAQIAQLNDTLRHVQVEGNWSLLTNPPDHRLILFPLCKIKARKSFITTNGEKDEILEYDDTFQELLQRAEDALKASSKVRGEATKAEAAERAERERVRREEKEKEEQRRKKRYEPVDPSVIARRQQYDDPGFDGGTVELAEECMSKAEREDGTRIEHSTNELAEHSELRNDHQDSHMEPESDDDVTNEEWVIVSPASDTSTPRDRTCLMDSKDSDGS